MRMKKLNLERKIEEVMKLGLYVKGDANTIKFD